MKKYSVACGINYNGSDNELNGCFADTDFWESYAKHTSFDTMILSKEKECTKKLMKLKMQETLIKSKEKDLVYISYSGHGTIVPPGVQAWCPYDFEWDNPETWFTYDELDQMLCQHEQRGVLVVILSDSCHSEADPRKHLRSLKKAKSRYLKPPKEIQRKIISQPFGRNILTADQDDLFLAGCGREQTSADAEIDGGYHGAFTYACSLALKPFMDGYAAKPPSYQEVILSARAWLAGEGFDQVPSGKGDSKILRLPFLTEGLTSVSKKR